MSLAITNQILFKIPQPHKKKPRRIPMTLMLVTRFWQRKLRMKYNKIEQKIKNRNNE